jgi:activator of 2-hydroxyglutaryl-CoA dehydratase
MAPARDLPFPSEKALAVQHERRVKMRIGIDIGGTKIVVGLVNEAGRVTAHKKVRTESDQGYRGKLWDIIKGQVEGLNAGHIEEASMLGDELCRRAWGEAEELQQVPSGLLTRPGW